jgi:GNAT superfamily N-acetyltransferase
MPQSAHTRRYFLPASSIVIRPVGATDDLDKITCIIRTAYAQLSEMGLRYWATFQSVEDTQQRFADGHGLIALIDETVVGTITIYDPKAESDVNIYCDPTTYCIGQFAVDPTHQGKGIGRLLHDQAIDHISSRGGTRSALDTAEQATHLIDLYTKWGYRIVGRADWRPLTNYESVVMVKEL